jgi:FtsH-binding integral membrane protein
MKGVMKGGGMKGVMKGLKMNKMLDILFQKRQLLVMIFANLIVQLGITYYVFLKSDLSKMKGVNIILLVISLFVILFLIGFLPMPSWLKFILFTLFSYLQGLFLSSLKTEVNQKMIQTAIVGALSIFVFMFLFGLGLLTVGISLTSKFGMFLFWSLLFLIIFEVVSIFLGAMPMMQKGFAFVGLLLFSIYIVYDTNTILQRNYYGDFITASMEYYLDILNIFLDILSLNNN